MEVLTLLIAFLLSTVFITFWSVTIFGAIQILCTPGPQWPSLRRGITLSSSISIMALVLLTLII